MSDQQRQRVDDAAPTIGGLATHPWTPWLGAAAAFVLAVQTVTEVLDVDTALVPLVAIAAAAPLALVVSLPLAGWALSAGSALVVSRAFPVIDGDPWSFPTVHGLVLLVLVFAVARRPPGKWRQWLRGLVIAVVAVSTAALFAASTPSDIRAGWVVGVGAIAAAGIAVRLVGTLAPSVAPEPPASARAIGTRALGGFQEAFISWVSSPPLGPPMGRRLLATTGPGGWARGALPWLLAFGVFWIAVVSTGQTLVVHDLVLPAFAALIALPVALCHRHVLLGWRLITVLAVVVATVGTAPDDADSATWPVILQWVWLACTFLVSIRHRRWTTVWIWVATVAVMSAGAADDAGVAVTLIVSTTAVVIIGDLIRVRRLVGRDLERQAELSELEKARRTVLEERTRIARDLHDVVAHHMSMVVVQAETAPYRLGELSPEATAEFAAVGASARQALNEVRGMLGVLRSADHASSHTPQPGEDDIHELIGAAQRSGVPVQLTTTGTAGTVSAAVALSMYRIIQESLANAARHAPGAEVHVTLTYAESTVEVHVVNTAPEAPAPVGPPGHGLIGMRERARVVSGTLSTTATPDGGFEVRAAMPLEAEEQPGEPS